MANTMKLTVLTLLVGAVSVIGCSDDDNGGTGGTGGTAACVQDCGEDNEFPTGAETASESFSCNLSSAVGFEFFATFEIDFAGIPDGDVVANQENTYNTTMRATVPVETVNTLIETGNSETTVALLEGTAASSQGSSSTAEVTSELATPCTLCFSEGTLNEIVSPETAITYELDQGDTQGIRLEILTLTLDTDAAGQLTFSNAEGGGCIWGVFDEDDQPLVTEGPEITFMAGGGGAGGNGGNGGGNGGNGGNGGGGSGGAPM